MNNKKIMNAEELEKVNGGLTDEQLRNFGYGNFGTVNGFVINDHVQYTNISGNIYTGVIQSFWGIYDTVNPSIIGHYLAQIIDDNSHELKTVNTDFIDSKI